MADDYATRVMWPFPPNWADAYSVSYEFRTDIFTSDNGLEQRRALRTTPRKTIEFTAAVNDDGLRQFNRVVDTAQNALLILPELTRETVLTQDLAGGSAQAVVGSVPAWLTPGTEVVLSDPAYGYTYALVDAVAGGQISFHAPPGPRRLGTKLHPALTGRLPSSFAAKRRTSALAQPQVSFAVLPTSELYPATLPLMTYGDYEVLNLSPSWGDGTAVSHEWPVEVVDLGRGRTSTYVPIDFATAVRTLNVVAASVEDLVAMFVRMRGQRGSFWASTYEPDMVPAADFAGSTIDVLGTETYFAYRGDQVRVAIEIYAPGVGTWHASIVGYDLAGNNTRLTLAENLPPIPALSIARVSWLTLARFASDTLTCNYASTGAVRASVGVRTLPNVALTGNLRATAEGDIRDTDEGDNRAVIYL